jgi:hypothetical protein
MKSRESLIWPNQVRRRENSFAGLSLAMENASDVGSQGSKADLRTDKFQEKRIVSVRRVTRLEVK